MAWSDLCMDIAELIRNKLSVMALVSSRRVCKSWRAWTTGFTSEKNRDVWMVAKRVSSEEITLLDLKSHHIQKLKIQGFCGWDLVGSVGSWGIFYHTQKQLVRIRNMVHGNKKDFPRLPSQFTPLLCTASSLDLSNASATCYLICKHGRAVFLLNAQCCSKTWEIHAFDLGFDHRYIDSIYFTDDRLYLTDGSFTGIYSLKEHGLSTRRSLLPPRFPPADDIPSTSRIITLLGLPSDSSLNVTGTVLNGFAFPSTKFKKGTGKRDYRAVYLSPVFSDVQ